MDLRIAMQKFCGGYRGLFGEFELDGESDGNLSISTHEVASRYVSASVVMFSRGDDADSEFEERAEFVRSKSRPTPMGQPEPIEDDFGFDRWIGYLNNFDMMGSKGGFIYCAGLKEDAVVSVQAYSTNAQIAEGDLKAFFGCIHASLSRSDSSSASSSDSR